MGTRQNRLFVYSGPIWDFGGKQTMKILLVADHTLFRDGIKLLLQQSRLLTHCKEAKGLQAALKLLAADKFDLIILDIKLRDSIGLDSLREIKRHGSLAPVITITEENDIHLANQAIAFGAAGHICKTSSYKELKQAIGTAVSGGVYLTPGLSDQLNYGHGRKTAVSDISLLSSLSDRQREVLHHLAKGTSNKAISVELNISQNTVKAHLATIFKVLGVHNRTEAFYFAARAGMPLE